MKMQKALHLYIEEDKKTPKYRGKNYAIFEKYDGWYGYYENGKIHSSAGRVIPSLTTLSKYLAAHRPDFMGRVIFEIMLPDMVFSQLNGVLNRKSEQALNAYLMVHDVVEVGDFPFHKRYERIDSFIQDLNPRILRKAPILGYSSDKYDWKHWAQRIWNNGGEGVILKHVDGFYEFGKRNCNLMKIKEELTLDLIVVGMEPGGGKYDGTLGTLTVQGKKGHKHHVSGMTDAQRDAWWANPESIIGQVVEVKAMKLLKDGSLREPRYKHTRHDKCAKDIDDV